MQADFDPATKPWAIRRGTGGFVILFWATQFSLLTAQSIMMMPEDSNLPYILPRLCVTLLGIILSFGIAAISQRFKGRPIRVRILLAFGLAAIGAMLHATGNFTIFNHFMPQANADRFSISSYMIASVQWFWAYLALSSLLLAFWYALESAERERRIAQLRGIADAAQLRALRYQLNPHFMFNTLNSIAALIARREVEPAELMVENLADFLRACLSLDPQADIPLDREIELQALYLAIEAVRFADRLEVRIDIPDEARSALVPSLVLQPLIENVVKHSVSTSTTPVTLDISARIGGERLHVCVRNGAGDGPGQGARGTGVGLNNVAERLRARFGEDCAFRADPQQDGGFAVSFAIPWSRGAAS
ncbi:MAG: histidine kinase [Sphingomonas sp.]